MVILSTLMIGCDQSKSVDQTYINTTTETYNQYVATVNSYVNEIGADSFDTQNIINVLNPLTDSCIKIMSQLDSNEANSNYHHKISEVYRNMKYGLIPAIENLNNIDKNPNTLDTTQNYQLAMQAFQLANESLKKAKKEAIQAQKEFMKANNIHIK